MVHGSGERFTESWRAVHGERFTAVESGRGERFTVVKSSRGERFMVVESESWTAVHSRGEWFTESFTVVESSSRSQFPRNKLVWTSKSIQV